MVVMVGSTSLWAAGGDLPGSGTEGDPYLIEDLADFDEFADSVNAATYWASGVYTRLACDIDLTGRPYTTAVIAPDTEGTAYFQGNLFAGIFDGDGHVIRNITIDTAGSGNDYLGLFGKITDFVSNVGMENINITGGGGSAWLGGLCGWNSYGSIANCYTTGSVSGGDWLGGLCGYNYHGKITNCDATGSVSGDDDLGGLCGRNTYGTITNCYSGSSVNGDDHLGGLCGYSHHGTITNCYATGSVTGDDHLGGLCGYDHYGTITNCYSGGSVTGDDRLGGLCGRNYGTITNCYATGSVTGGDGSGYLGGLCGRNRYGPITNCFWDIETGGPDNGAGTPLPTAEMQTLSTFIDAGWDFAGETVNGIEDIWFIPQGDYPHLWWEGVEVSMKLTPRTLNCGSKGNWVKAHLTLPEEFTVADVDPNRPAVLRDFNFESAPLNVFVNENELVEIEAAFRREDICSLASDWPDSLTVYGFFSDGSIFLGTSTVRIITPGLNDIHELAAMWLEMDCSPSDWCGGMDLNQDSMVNFADFALLQSGQIEFVSK